MSFPIGFTSSHEPARAVPKVPDDAMFSFDSGSYLTLEDMSHHFLVLGTSGSGKSCSCAFPIISRMMERGCAGLMVDLKGNLRDKIRRLAWAAGCQDRIVEYGTGKYAKPVNLMANLTVSGCRMFLDRLVKGSFDGKTGNMDFHAKGISQAVDCAQLLQFLEGRVEGVEVNAALLAEMLENERHAQALYRYFKEKVYDPENWDHAEFVQAVESDRFHVLFRQEDVDFFDSARQEQMNYCLTGVKTALRAFLSTPHIREKFCASGCPGVDVAEDLVRGNLVVLRFDPDTGPAGDDLARMFISEFYSGVYKYGLELPWHTFVLLDEYQEIADLGDGRFSDKRFVAMAREFGSSAVFLTQSLSALGGKENASGVEALVANCNCRVVFYSDDPLTQGMVGRYGDFDLTTLEPQQAFVVRYNAAARKHVHSLETMNGAYWYGQERLALGATLEVTPEVLYGAPGRPLREIARFVAKIVPEEKDEEEEMERKADEWRQACKEEEEREVEEKEGVLDMRGVRKEVVEAIMEHDRKHEVGNPLAVEPSDTLKEVMAEFPQFFADDLDDLALPVGWKDLFIGALSALAASNLQLKITRIWVRTNRSMNLEVSSLPYYDMGKTFFNEMIADITEYCPICGAYAGKSRERSMNLCDGCRKKFRLPADSEGGNKNASRERQYDLEF